MLRSVCCKIHNSSSRSDLAKPVHKIFQCRILALTSTIGVTLLAVVTQCSIGNLEHLIRYIFFFVLSVERRLFWSKVNFSHFTCTVVFMWCNWALMKLYVKCQKSCNVGPQWMRLRCLICIYIFLRGNNHCTLLNAQLNLKSQQPNQTKKTQLLRDIPCCCCSH